MRMQANLNIEERFNGRGIIYVKRAIAQEVGILFVLVLLRNTASHAQGLEGSQTSPRRLKLREATSGSPPGVGPLDTLRVYNFSVFLPDPSSVPAFLSYSSSSRSLMSRVRPPKNEELQLNWNRG
jgi:hypothetical protein